MTTRHLCGCTFTSSRDASVRDGYQLSGALVHECEYHRIDRERRTAEHLVPPSTIVVPFYGSAAWKEIRQ
jgi:hypothetical protein